jgi:hypothetical protein
MVHSAADDGLARARLRFLEAWRTQRIRGRDGNSMPHFNPCEFWSAALDVLRAFRRTDLCNAVTPQLVDELALLLEELLAGSVPHKVRPLQRRGAPSLKPLERRARVCAAAYVHYARRGMIPDRAPVRTIRAGFGISERTATDWVKTPLQGDPWLPSEQLPEDVRAKCIAWAIKTVADEYVRKGRAQENRFKHRR